MKMVVPQVNLVSLSLVHQPLQAQLLALSARNHNETVLTTAQQLVCTKQSFSLQEPKAKHTFYKKLFRIFGLQLDLCLAKVLFAQI